MSINEIWMHLIDTGDVGVLKECATEILATGLLINPGEKLVEKVMNLSALVCCSDSVHKEDCAVD